jgi:hypothetical protein
MGKSKNFGSRASSVRGAFWQSRVLVLALALAAPATAAPGGDIDTMPIGDYVCELPGDATGPAGRRVAEEDFTIVTASSYRAGEAMGSYLLTGDQLTMTSGAHQGKRYRRQSEGFVRMIGADGQAGDLRCVRQTRNNS